jgi:predicted ATPase
MSSGARFVRADLHVHTRPDTGSATARAQDYVRAAADADLSVMAITDHNSIEAVAGVVEAAKGADLLVLPGIEITTHEGHLLAIFAPEAMDTLQDFATRQNLRLEPDPQDQSLRSSRSMLELVHEIGGRGGLAIPAHVDAKDGIHEAMPGTALVQLLADPALAGLEFASHEAMRSWFTEDDDYPVRQQAWRARLSVAELGGRGLARVMSSDAHSPEKVGGDRPSRTMTRLRLDEPTFDAVRNAILFNPKARCKAEVDLPAAYPQVLSASFRGGFLDGMEVEFSPNLNCFIGGRGAGKSTALIAIRAALGADLEGDDDPDDPDRMPDITTVRFLDRAGNERTSIRQKGQEPSEQDTEVPIELELADMGQGASGRLARDYAADPSSLRNFLDGFVDLRGHKAKQALLLERLEDNASEITRANQGLSELPQVQREVAQLQSTLKAAENSQVEKLAQYAAQLTAESQLLERLDELTGVMLDPGVAPVEIDLEALASETGTNLAERPAADHLAGEHDVDRLAAALAERRAELRAHVETQLSTAGAPLREELSAWKAQHSQWSERMQQLQRELDQRGLKVQAGEVLRVSTRLNAARERVRQLEGRKVTREQAWRDRKALISDLMSDHEAEHQRRRVTLRRVVERVNKQADGLRIHISIVENGDNRKWCDWLTANLRFRHPKVARMAADVSPQQFAAALRGRAGALESLRADGAAMLDEGQLSTAKAELRNYPVVFELETMRLDDRVHIDVSDPGAVERRPFDHLSAGQQRSVLLSLMLSADRDEPLIIDQPEDHLDAQYIAHSVVRQLEAAKERRQVIIATHSANLVVLGDAELVIPMVASHGHGHSEEPGAVDRPQTRELVCQVLEGGRGAFKRRGERYGFEVRPAVR